MSYEDLDVVAHGDPNTPERANQVRDNFAFLAGPPRCRVRNSGAISIANNTETYLTFDLERFDTDTMHSISVNTGRITFTTGGVYLVGGSVKWQDATADINRAERLFIRRSGTTELAETSCPILNNGGTPLSVATLYEFAAGDYVELGVYQNSGGALNIVASGDQSPEFWAIWQAL